ncbi:hypothetical protein A2276_08560 [candidate division WOR-1 bacterium RIFOXYA12_FULL_43_27]|nr:MAG: hypothetical protein A2276_08560 [candidate division WOR-1 bacterium RIFOXYA12_FULL_43_27]
MFNYFSTSILSFFDVKIQGCSSVVSSPIIELYHKNRQPKKQNDSENPAAQNQNRPAKGGAVRTKIAVPNSKTARKEFKTNNRQG